MNLTGKDLSECVTERLEWREQDDVAVARDPHDPRCR